MKSFITGILFAITLAACSQNLNNQTDNFDEFKQIEILALSGDAEAQYKLGAAYEHGYGISINETKAREWYLSLIHI